ncbi:TldD/PmbA family protein [Frankia sp. CNm7]|uniref:TldD/PmbA family protein n=1 Tax=Frankia nepalensis TaxID=1836974 RepID=A0A937RPD3_9ACTN|nr:metallopeptidase TldD-related protein [Frankia nepalensis]MBL7496279.1 TldD/PmbA family protein [Frankia nepalensis]MBL7513829.1 TldD/PmbA family protein [Frankia nepalensis]MBL7517568.1 TldD/PmbA family protein [Frankia nepalensis]MBL7633742.1 TldD/PmbA family protein [Frankia nepalensis]
MTQPSHEIVERALAASKADGCVVIASESSTVNLRWANNTLTTNGAARDRSVTVVSVIGRSFGVRSVTSLDSGPNGSEAGVDKLTELVRASEAAARDADEAEDYGELLGPGQPGAAVPVEGEAFDEPARRTSTAVFARFAAELGDALRAARAEGRALYGFAEHDLTTTWLGTSGGLRLRHSQPTGSVEWNAKNDQPGGSVWHGQSTHDFTDVDVAATDAELRRRLSWGARQVELPAGRYETLLPPSAVSDLILEAYWSAAGRDAAEGRTVYSRAGGGTRLGEVFGPSGLRLSSDPADPELSCAPFVVTGHSSATSSVFDNGLALGRTNWFEDGKLAAMLHTRSSARAAGAAPTPFIDNLTMDGGGTATLDEMVASTDRGLLLTCLWYIREVDPEVLLLTGLTRDGVYLVEKGEVVGVVNNFRFNESPVNVLGRISEIGAATRTLGREWADWFKLSRMPAIRVPDFNMSSVSPAS